MNNRTILNNIKYLVKNAGEFGCEDLENVQSIDEIISTKEPDAAIITLEIDGKRYSITVASLV